MLPLTKPKRFIPIHGEFRMQVQHGRLDGRVALIPMNEATGHDLRAPHEFPRLRVGGWVAMQVEGCSRLHDPVEFD